MKENKQPRVKILVACHKADPNIRQDDIYMPIQVGKALHPELDLGFQCDNTGDNISEKNGSYCELTALYWAWKNLKDIDYIGLCHYHRYFSIYEHKISQYLKNYDIIIPKLIILSKSIFEELCLWTSLEEAHIFIDSIMKIFPEYKDDIIHYYFKSNKFTQCNMFVTSKEQYDNYCSFLFRILEDVYTRIEISPYSRQKRVIGYLGETLLGLWIRHNKRKLLKVNIISSNQNRSFKEILNDIRRDIAFSFSKSYNTPQYIPIYKPVMVGFEQDNISLPSIIL